MTPEAIAALAYRPCVGVVLLNSAGAVFAGQRIDNPGDAWQMPQGGVDEGEAPRDAALRELGEETGVAPHLVDIIGETDGWIPYDLPLELVPRLWNGRYRGQKQKWFLMRFSGTDADVTIDTEHAEFSRWCWMTPETLLERIVPFKRDVYETVFAVFGDTIKKA